LDKYYVLDSRFAKFFSISKQELNDTINFQFDLQPELKNQIFSNIDTWYNGYYGNEPSSMYSTFSTQQYLNKCRYEYDTWKKHPNETSYSLWIPEPQPYWTKSNITNILNNYLSIGFEGEFNRFLLSLTKNNQAIFNQKQDYYPPMLEDPAVSNHREKIIFHLLLHTGYLTVDNRNTRYFKIPNKELLGVFRKQLDYYLKNFPISDELISDLSNALLDQNYANLGDVIMKSLYAYSSEVDATKNFTSKEEVEFNAKYKVGHGRMTLEQRKSYPQEAHIHNILWRAFDRVSQDNTFMVEQEFGKKGVFSSSGEYIN
jgi:hypothetical protein